MLLAADVLPSDDPDLEAPAAAAVSLNPNLVTASQPDAAANMHMGVVVLVSAATHTAELFLRRSYAENVQAKMQEQQTEERRGGEVTRGRQLEERNEQLRAEKKRLLYDMQRRGRPLDDDDDRSAIRRGLQAGSSQPCLLHGGDTDPGEPGGAPSDTPLTLPPGAPSSASSGSVASYAQKQLAAEAGPGLERVELAELAELVEVTDEEVIRMVQAQPGVPMTIQRAMPTDVGAAQQSIRVVQAQVSGAYQPGVPMTIQRAVPVLCFSSQGLDSTAVATAANAQQLDSTSNGVSGQDIHRHLATHQPLSPTVGINVAAPPSHVRYHSDSELRQLFDALVMCDFTPRHPNALPESQWVSFERLFQLFQPLAPLDVWWKGPGNLKQRITKWYKGDPTFIGLDPTAWCKPVTAKNAPQDQHPRGSGKKCPYNAFCFEHTPRQLPGPPGL